MKILWLRLRRWYTLQKLDLATRERDEIKRAITRLDYEIARAKARTAWRWSRPQ